MSGGGSTESGQFTPQYKRASQETVGRARELSKQPYTPYTGQRLADFNPYEMQAFGGVANRALGGSPITTAGSDMLTNTLSGGFLQGNPYINQIVGQAQGDIADQYRYMTGPNNMALASSSGSLNNTGVAGKDMMDRFSAARAMGDVENQLRFGNYATERANQFNALAPGMAYANQPYTDMAQLQGAGEAQRMMGQAQLDIPYQQFQEQQQHPYQQLDFLTGIINNLSGGGRYGSQTASTSNQVPWYTFPLMIGGGLAGNPGVFGSQGAGGGK